jgi:hypothetical protein
MPMQDLRSLVRAPIWGLAAALLVALVGVACAEQSGAASPSAAADAYLAALGARDPAAMRRIVPPDFEAEMAIVEKLQKYAGIDVGSLNRAYVPHDVTPNIVKVVITADAPLFEDVISVQRFGRTWYVTLGRLRGFTPGPTAQIRPPST